MNKNRKQATNLFNLRMLGIKLAVKEMQSAKFYAILLVSVILAGFFSLSPTIPSLIVRALSPQNDTAKINCTGRIATATAAPIAYKSEIRGVFVHSATFFAGPHDWEVIAQTCKNYKINVIFGEFLFPNPSGLFGEEIADAIAACHPRDMKVFASMNVLYYDYSYIPDRMVETHTGVLVNNGMCPTKASSRTLLKSLVEELAGYDIDGVMFDYTRYPVRDDVCYCPECRAKFEADTGVPLTSAHYPGGASHGDFMEWRVRPITELVNDIRNWMSAVRESQDKPPLEFSVASWTLFQDSPTYWRYWLGQDTADWVGKGYLDAVAPMMYGADLAKIEDNVQTNFKYLVGGPEGKIPLLALITTGVGDPVDPLTFKAVVDKVRELGCDGWIIWRYGGPGCGVTPDITDYLSLLNMSDVFSLGDIEVSVDKTQAIITWATDLAATSKVEYSTAPLFNATKRYNSAMNFDYWDVDHVLGTLVEDVALVTAHSMSLTGLNPGTTYYFRVQSEGSSGIATNKVLTFTTSET